jgi:methionine synthase II (cobalamin-independent)
MFSTLLGPLPAPPGADATSAGDSADPVAVVLAALDEIGLELVTTGAPSASPDLAAADIVEGWREAAALSARPVKQVLMGPYTAGRDHGPSGPAAIAESVRSTIDALADAGCPFIEIDEPEALAIAVVEGERRRFIDAHRRLVDGLSGIHVSLAVSRGNLDAAGPATFFDLPYASYAFDLIAGPDNWRLAVAAPGDRGIVCGAIDPREGGDETPELLVWAAHYAASSSGRSLDRVGLANAPSLAPLPWDAALRKLRRVADATRIASIPSPHEMASKLDPRAVSSRRAATGAPLRPAASERD